MVIKPNKTRLKIDYHAASPSLRGGISIKMDDLPDPYRLKSPLNKFAAIAEECTSELEPYSRYLGRKTSDPKSLNAFSLIPKIIIEGSKGGSIIKERLSNVVNNGIGMISLENLYKSLGQRPLVKILKKGYIRMSQLVNCQKNVAEQRLSQYSYCTKTAWNLSRDINIAYSKKYHIGEGLKMTESAGAILYNFDDSINPFGDCIGQSAANIG